MAERIVSDAERVSVALLEEQASPDVVETAHHLVRQGLMWVYDNDVDGVTGLKDIDGKYGPRGWVLMVCYLNDGVAGEGDFETSDSFDSVMGSL